MACGSLYCFSWCPALHNPNSTVYRSPLICLAYLTLCCILETGGWRLEAVSSIQNLSRKDSFFDTDQLCAKYTWCLILNTKIQSIQNCNSLCDCSLTPTYSPVSINSSTPKISDIRKLWVRYFGLSWSPLGRALFQKFETVLWRIGMGPRVVLAIPQMIVRSGKLSFIKDSWWLLWETPSVVTEFCASKNVCILLK